MIICCRDNAKLFPVQHLTECLQCTASTVQNIFQQKCKTLHCAALYPCTTAQCTSHKIVFFLMERMRPMLLGGGKEYFSNWFQNLWIENLVALVRIKIGSSIQSGFLNSTSSVFHFYVLCVSEAWRSTKPHSFWVAQAFVRFPRLKRNIQSSEDIMIFQLYFMTNMKNLLGGPLT